MTEEDVEIIIQRAREKYPEVGPGVISDNSPQFIAKEFKAPRGALWKHLNIH